LTLRFNGCTPGVRDGTFERGQPWPDWTVQTSTQFATPLCNVGLCGDGEVRRLRSAAPTFVRLGRSA
jgi:hypothetical protein